MVSKEATRTVPPQAASESPNASPPIRQQAQRKKKIESTCHRNNAQSVDKWVIRMDAAIMLGNSVMLACEVKNAELSGYRCGSTIFLMPGT
jgi:hypothetical protein